ncbi:tryptophan-rich sensory protein, partial [Candidatus Bathyarchaeota archaeon]|nr:tryptophan-rich sensory protein [Candidatus Bathyarchaeota archaeon]
MSSARQPLLRWTNVASFGILVVVNALAGSTRLLNGKTSGEISDFYPTLITPAGYTFSIWGLIYVLLLAFVIYQAMPTNRDKSFLGRISFLFALSTIFNIVWLVLWHYEFLAPSVILMFGLLATLIAIYLRLDIGKGNVSITERIAVHVPFSVYLGWITIATIANVAVVLTAVDWDTGGIDLVSWAAL